MAPRKDKNKINVEGDHEHAAAASKRRKSEPLNGTTGLTFTNAITEFPSNHLLQQQHNRPQNTTAIGADLQLCPPAAIPQTQEEEPAEEDGVFVSSLIPQQNLLISYHMNQMRLSVEEFWHKNFTEEVKKRKEIEARLKQKDEQVDRFRKMYHFYAERTFLLEEILQRRVTGEGCSAPAATAVEEEVQSCFVEPNNGKGMDVACRNCRTRPATMVWLPCRHLCVCLVCVRRVKTCVICGDKKTESCMINVSLP